MTNLNRSLIVDIPIFKGVAPRELDAIVAQARATRYPREAVVFEQDSEAHAFFLLLDGYIQVVRTTPSGAKVIARYIPAGEFFGIAVALGRTTYPATAIAAVDCVSLVWPNSAWAHLSSAFPPFGAGVYKNIGSRLEDAQSQAAELSTERVEKRVARALLRLANSAGRERGDGIEIDFPLSREDLAQMTGATLHTISRILSRWETEGWVGGGRQRVVVTDLPALTRLADED